MKYKIVAKDENGTIEKEITRKPSKKCIDDMFKKYTWFQVTKLDKNGKIVSRNTYEVVKNCKDEA